jgi:hypothetical protein
MLIFLASAYLCKGTVYVCCMNGNDQLSRFVFSRLVVKLQISNLFCCDGEPDGAVVRWPERCSLFYCCMMSLPEQTPKKTPPLQRHCCVVSVAMQRPCFVDCWPQPAHHNIFEYTTVRRHWKLNCANIRISWSDLKWVCQHWEICIWRVLSSGIQHHLVW